MAAWTGGVVGRWWKRRGAAWTTLAVVLFLEGSLVFGAVLPLGALDSVSGAVAVLALQLLVLLMLASGIIVTSADPGYVPLQPASAGDDEESEEQAAVEGGGAVTAGRISLSEFLTSHERECSFCCAPKPQSAHHCSLCQRNMKAFSLFIVYALLCALSGFAFFVARAEADHTEEYLAWAVALTVANLGLLAFVIVATTWLCVRHLRAILRNQTFLEILLNKPPEHNPGPLANLKRVFGDEPWLWLLPSLATGPPPTESHDSARFVHTASGPSPATATLGHHHHDDEEAPLAGSSSLNS
ncbi:DHHC zinc finger domain containing protein [Acanthamoeba castellanii str. Neff]|uniref:DHHC zinc finger domain containing protein n=1 Tax=Acanthamoeba castellanii (strain ATCC 30010 / Neff) TaxID=1257118 RepID=L8GXG4_ACACF|nr:DHHC zinc finger domain containing protein [Acanthamoeba castellanii str. Neff]ELR17617.1 DHHC zinc finger domain containing protein [Acanthamoeba castellanii str. Neff]